MSIDPSIVQSSEKFVVTLNNQRYFFKITMSNGDKSSQILELPYSFVEELKIEETLFNWFTTATLILKNDYEFFEKGAVLHDPNGREEIVPAPYVFRHDGRNKINIRIYPILDETTTGNTYPDLTEINYDYVVYSIEDLYAKDLSKKRKKLFLWDERYQHFIERNIQWSTYYPAAELLKTDKFIPDISCRVGTALKHLIQTACGEAKNVPFVENSTPLKVGWQTPYSSSVVESNSYTNTTQNINVPTLNVARFSKSWDEGPLENKISYTSPASNNVVDDINYLLKYYTSCLDQKDKKGLGMPGLLRLNRYSKEWSLIGLDQVYAKALKENNQAGEDTIETIFIQHQTDGSLFGYSMSPNADVAAIQSRTNTVYNYRFVSQDNTDDFIFCNRPVINYENNTGLWNIHFEENTPDNVVTMLNKNFIPKVFRDTTRNATNGVLINLNKSKLNGISTTPEHVVFQGSAAKVLSRNNMIYSSIFLNQALEFSTIGFTVRTPGKFININEQTTNTYSNTEFAKKFQGQWLITRVVHTFYNDKYLNNMVCVKFNSFNELSVFNTKNDLFKE